MKNPNKCYTCYGKCLIIWVYDPTIQKSTTFAIHGGIHELIFSHGSLKETMSFATSTFVTRHNWLLHAST